MKFSCKKITILSIFSGLIARYVILHLLSLIIYTLYNNNVVNWLILKQTFTADHFPMGVYFALIGGLFGALYSINFCRIKKVHDYITKISLTDELTGINNRRYFKSKLLEELERAKRYSKPLTIMILDLNNFKQVNDNYGHIAGDILLKNIAVLLKDSIRRPDFIARYGGDEFIIIMPETHKNTAHILAERLKEKISRYNFKNSGNKIIEKISFCMGIAEFPGEADSINEL